MYLGTYSCTDVDGEFSGKCRIVTDYSGMVFDKKRREFLVFGGGHGSTNYDGLNAFNMNTLSWNEKYKPTSCSAMVNPNNYDRANGAWLSDSSGPYPRPAARHTVDLMVYAESIDGLVLLTHVEGNGPCPGVTYTAYNFATTGKIPQYDLTNNQWTFSDDAPPVTWPAAEYDPVSQKIVILGSEGLMIYDPVTKKNATAIDLRAVYGVQDESGSIIASDMAYNNHLVYFPPNDKMYYFQRQTARTFEITLDRTDFSKSRIVQLNTFGLPSPHVEPGYAYDAVNHIIGGGVYANKFYAFNPLTKSWTVQSILGGAPGNEAFHAIGYDDANNVFVFITEDRQTWAYRYH
jgi:hypothetical protein